MSFPRDGGEADASPAQLCGEFANPAWRSEAFQGYANDAARRNQRLAITWSTLSPIDIQDLVAALNRTAASAIDSGELDAALAIATILTTGRSLQEVSAFAISSGAARTGEGLVEGLLMVGSGWAWCLAPHVSDSDRKIQSHGTDPRVFVKCEQHLLLECPTVVQGLIRARTRFGHSNGREIGRSGPLFQSAAGTDPGWIEKLEADMRKWLNGVRGDDPRRKLSPAIARHWLLSEIFRVPGADLGAANAITGSKPDAEISGTYGVYKVEYLRGVYREAVRPFNKVLTPKIELPGGFIGRPKTPRDETMRELGAALQRPLSKPGRPIAIERQNAMVRYTVAMLMVATGARPNATLTARIDREAGYAILYDKAVQEPRARALWIPNELAEQLQLYEEHLAALLPHLSLTARKTIHDLSRADGGSCLPIFYLDKNSHPTKMAASEVWRNCIQAIQPKLYSNSHRHFLHAKLAGRSAPESIQAVFGHWNVGTEPWSKTSGFDPLLYRADVQPKISSLLNELGWVPRHGLRAKNSRKASQEIAGFLSVVGENRPNVDSGWGSPGRRTNSPFNGCVRQPPPSLPAHLSKPVQKAATRPLDQERRIGLLLASAIENGLLLDPRWWGAWLKALPNAKRSKEVLWLEMEPPAPNDPQHVYCYPRRWFADELSRVLIDRWQAQFGAQDLDNSTPSPESCLAAFLDPQRQADPEEIVEQFMASSVFNWRLKVPGLILDYAIGQSPSVSVDKCSWARLTGGRTERDPPEEKPAKKTKDPGIVFNVPDEILNHIKTWTDLAKKQRQVGVRAWGQRRAYATRTVADYSSSLKKTFSFQEVSPNSWNDPDDLDRVYTEHMLALEPGSARNVTVKAIELFQAYLVEAGITENTGESYWDFMVEGHVSNNLVASRDFERALNLLKRDDRTSRMYRLILILAFRTGMRDREILALEFGDLSDSVIEHGRSAFCEIRLKRSLKNDQSRRVIPIDVLLSATEQDELRAWVAKEKGRSAWQEGNLLFNRQGGGRGALHKSEVCKQIGALLQDASDDKSLSFNHLRHSFVSYLVASLLLPRDGMRLERPASVDETCISEQRRDRIFQRTIGKARIGTPVLHVVSQLCGHRPTSTTLRWYNHLFDWCTGAYVTRKLLDPLLPASVAAGLAEMEPSSAVGADFRARKTLKARPPSSVSTASYQLPVLAADHQFRDGFVRLSSVRGSIDRKNRRGPLQEFTQVSLRQQNYVVYSVRSLPTPANDSEIAWPLVRNAVLKMRDDDDPAVVAAAIGLDAETVSRWRDTADQLIQPRRQGETRPPFLHKMNKERREKFDVSKWTALFPQPPRGPEIDVADQIWNYAVPHLTASRAKEALHYFCQHYSTDTGLTTFSKKEEAKRFYRGFAELGFLGSMTVGTLESSSKRAVSKAAENATLNSPRFHATPELQLILESTLPRSLKSQFGTGFRKTPSKVPWPKYMAIRLNHPLHVKPKCTEKCRCRSAILFAVLMLSIYALDRVREPPRRYPWKPGYGGYFPKERYPVSKP